MVLDDRTGGTGQRESDDSRNLTIATTSSAVCKSLYEVRERLVKIFLQGE